MSKGTKKKKKKKEPPSRRSVMLSLAEYTRSNSHLWLQRLRKHLTVEKSCDSKLVVDLTSDWMAHIRTYFVARNAAAALPDGETTIESLDERFVQWLEGQLESFKKEPDRVFVCFLNEATATAFSLMQPIGTVPQAMLWYLDNFYTVASGDRGNINRLFDEAADQILDAIVTDNAPMQCTKCERVVGHPDEPSTVESIFNCRICGCQLCAHCWEEVLLRCPMCNTEDALVFNEMVLKPETTVKLAEFDHESQESQT